MKKTTLLLSIAFIAFVGCNKEDNNNGKLDPTAMISLRPEVNTRASDNPERLSALEIVKRTSNIYFWNKDIRPDIPLGAGFGDGQRDTVNVRLFMHGTAIIAQSGDYVPSFIEAEDIVFVETHADQEGVDTIAYIKNATLNIAEAQIKEAYAKEDYAACYEIFNEAFRFIPITGAEYRELEAKGEN